MKISQFAKEPYIILNVTFMAVILAIFVYSAVYSASAADHPVDCQLKKLTGKPCATCGLSRSFSEIGRGNISAAIVYNRNGILIFCFFAIQFVLRIATTIIFIKKSMRTSNLAIFDALVSIVLFVFTFRNLIFFQYV